MTKHWLGGRTALGAVVVVLGGSVACGSSFDEDNCKTRHTCPVADGQGGNDDAADGGAGSDAAGGAAPGNGLAGTGGASMEEPAECERDADCDNADASDGSETCFSGKCVAGNVAPEILSVTPEDEATDVEPDGTIVIEVSEALDEATVNAENVQVLDGDVPVAGSLSYEGNEITFTPDEPLSLLVPYEVRVSTGVTDAAGAPLAADFESSFRVRDGVWQIVPVVEGQFHALGEDLELNARGDVLVTWQGAGANFCPATAQWFNRGVAAGVAKTFRYGHDELCLSMRSAVSPNGTAILSWFEEDNSVGSAVTVEYRAGKWQLPTERNTYPDHWANVAVSDDGTAIYANLWTYVWQSTQDGVWLADPVELQSSSNPGSDGEIATVADAHGNVVFAWRAKDGDGIRSVQYAERWGEDGTLSSAAVLPGGKAPALGKGNERGVPQLAMDSEGRAMALWQRGLELVSNIQDKSHGIWSGIVKASGSFGAFPAHDAEFETEPPALVFDGKTFVSAYTATVDKAYETIVGRYDRDANSWTAEAISTAAFPGVARMPQLGTDSHGNLLLVWMTPGTKTGEYRVAYRRYDAGAATWLDPALVPELTFTNADLAKGAGGIVFGSSASGVAAFTVSDRINSDQQKQLRLVSFH